MKSKVHFSGTLLIMAVFAIDTISGMWLEIIGTPDPETFEAWGYQLLDMLANKSWFTYVPYLLLGLIVVFRFWPHLLRRLNFDILDVALLFIYLASCVITTIDYYTNDNMREWLTDALSFAFITAFILLIKIAFWIKWKR